MELEHSFRLRPEEHFERQPINYHLELSVCVCHSIGNRLRMRISNGSLLKASIFTFVMLLTESNMPFVEHLSRTRIIVIVISLQND